MHIMTNQDKSIVEALQCSYCLVDSCCNVVFLGYAYTYYLKQVAENSKGKSKNIVKMNWTVVASKLTLNRWRFGRQDCDSLSGK